MKFIISIIFLISIVFSNLNSKVIGDEWQTWGKNEKEVFLNGFYSSLHTLNKYLEDAIKFDSAGDPYWEKPFVLVMYEQNLKEFSSIKIGPYMSEIIDRLDAFYQKQENIDIPVIEAIRIICLRADGQIERADWFVLQNRRNIRTNQ
ncbi:MAG: hypothetical protein CMF96_03815 [Candidatus Marinimicrobia bacterium]|nr:hypothetical protein [Candidatus Neomarinimicrobiota bacterium]|tara:strand:+ start:3684 stop:4124 length:441 start_codon:yes stop_codon:yes gene_type:complete